MRTFKIGHGDDRKFVVLEVRGSLLRVTKGNSDGTSRLSEKELPGEAEAQSACERMARELISRGYVERNSSSPSKEGSARPVAASSKKAASSDRSDGLDLGLLAEAGEGNSEAVESLLPRLAPTPAAEVAPKKKKAGKKKKK